MRCSYIAAGLSFSVFNPTVERENERRGEQAYRGKCGHSLLHAFRELGCH